MATAKKSTSKAKVSAKSEAKTAPKTVKNNAKAMEMGLEKMTDFAGKFSGYTDGGVKAMTEQAAASTEVIRTLGARNMDFITKTLETSVETTQALTAAKDPREAMEIQSGYAKSFLTAYTSEMTAQAEMFMGAFRNAAKPMMGGFK